MNLLNAINGGNIIASTNFDNVNGSIDIDLSIVGANPAGVSGTGAIGKIRFRVKARQSNEIRFKEISEFRDENNQMIPIIERVKGIIITR